MCMKGQTCRQHGTIPRRLRLHLWLNDNASWIVGRAENASLHTWRATVPDPWKLNPAWKSLQNKTISWGLQQARRQGWQLYTWKASPGSLSGTETRSYFKKRECTQLTREWIETMARVDLFFCFSGLKKSSFPALYQAGPVLEEIDKIYT